MGPVISSSQQRCLAVEVNLFIKSGRARGQQKENQPSKTFFSKKAGMCIPSRDLIHKF